MIGALEQRIKLHPELAGTYGYRPSRLASTTPQRATTPPHRGPGGRGRAPDGRPRPTPTGPRSRRHASRGPRVTGGNDISRWTSHPRRIDGRRARGGVPGWDVALWRWPRRRGTRPTRPGEIACGHRPRPPLGRAITPGPASRNPRRATRPPPGRCVPPGTPTAPQNPTGQPRRSIRDHHRRTSRRGHRRGPFPRSLDEARRAGYSDDAPDESATDQPAAATEPADEDQALPVEANLAGDTAAALTQASSTDAEPGDAPVVAEAAEPVPATDRGDDTGDDTGGDPAGVELTADDPDRILHVDPAEMTCVCPPPRRLRVRRAGRRCRGHRSGRARSRRSPVVGRRRRRRWGSISRCP